MGAWGNGIFENDDAADWVGDLEEGGDASFLRSTLDAVAGTTSSAYVDAGEASCALAAAEVVAACAGAPAGDLPEEVTAWVADHLEAATPELVQQARAAVARMLAGSELLELWSEDGDPDLTEVRDLQRRLASPDSA